MNELQSKAIHAVKFHGSAHAAINSGKFDGDLLGQLKVMVVKDPFSLSVYPPGTRLRDDLGVRVIKSDIGVMVNLDTGKMVNHSDLVYPVEIYKYV